MLNDRNQIIPFIPDGSSGVWFDRDNDPLAAVRAYSNNMTVYIDSIGKTVRIIQAN